MQVKQLELNLWEAIASASQSPDEANLPMVFNLLDLTLIELDTRSQLRVAGDAVGQITDLFCDRSNLCFELLQARANHGENRGAKWAAKGARGARHLDRRYCPPCPNTPCGRLIHRHLDFS